MSKPESSISNHSLGDLLETSLTATPCVNIRKNAKVRVVAGMLVQYLETFTDSVVVRDDANPVGVIGGREIIQGVFKNPTSDFFEMKFVEEISDNKLSVVTSESSVKELISKWRTVRRTFAIINVGNDDYSLISARKLLEIGMKSDLIFIFLKFQKRKL